MAPKVVKCTRYQQAEAERAEIVIIHGFGAARKIVADIEATIAEHKASFTPSFGFPLIQIFEYCTVGHKHTTSVCRTWHLVAHSLGSL